MAADYYLSGETTITRWNAGLTDPSFLGIPISLIHSQDHREISGLLQSFGLVFDVRMGEMER